MPAVLEKTKVSGEYIDTLLEKGGRVWFTPWRGNQRGIARFGLEFTPNDDGSVRIALVYWTDSGNQSGNGNGGGQTKSKRRGTKKVQ